MDETAFKQFDIVSYHSDHFYSGVMIKQKRNGDGYGFMYGSRAYKNIMREWKILKENLPDTIYVRVYETRVDLMRAVIVGAPDTPYQDGLFFFDIWFPPDYPDHPPEVYYRSHGLSLNPMLNSDGGICLSLLNTWFGLRRSERWDSSRSTILQVLVSLQALVLNETPYYNDHERVPAFGYFLERIPFLRKLVMFEYKTYNARVFVSTCKSTLRLLKNPPKNFELFIGQHYRQRASGILRAIRLRIADGSLKYCTPMNLLYPQLVDSFRDIGWVEEEELLELAELKKRPFRWLFICFFVLHGVAMIIGAIYIYIYIRPTRFTPRPRTLFQLH